MFANFAAICSAVILTDSGEFSFWIISMHFFDIFALSCEDREDILARAIRAAAGIPSWSLRAEKSRFLTISASLGSLILS